MLLCRGTGVSRLAVLIQTALIDDAQATVVIVTGMGALHSLGQQRYDVTIVANIVVVRALTVLGYATGNKVLHAEGAVALVGHTMDDQELHRVMFQWFHNEILDHSQKPVLRKKTRKTLTCAAVLCEHSFKGVAQVLYKQVCQSLPATLEQPTA